jgi:hypothetical protein
MAASGCDVFGRKAQTTSLRLSEIVERFGPDRQDRVLCVVGGFLFASRSPDARLGTGVMKPLGSQ